jgi:hypothetical protein
MPENRLQRTREAYFPPVKCHDCETPIDGVIVWLGETYDGVPKQWPFHETCANGPWPLYEVARTQSETMK